MTRLFFNSTLQSAVYSLDPLSIMPRVKVDNNGTGKSGGNYAYRALNSKDSERLSRGLEA